MGRNVYVRIQRWAVFASSSQISKCAVAVVQDFVIQKFHSYSNYVVPPGLEVRDVRGSGGTDRPPREGRRVFHLSFFCP